MVQRVILPQATEVLNISTSTNSDGTAAANKAYVDLNSGGIFYDVAGVFTNPQVDASNLVLSTGIAANATVTEITIQSAGTAPAADIAQYFTQQGNTVPYRFTGSTQIFNVSAAVASGSQVNLTLLNSVTFTAAVLANTVLQQETTVATYTQIRDIVLGTNLTGMVANNAQNRPTLTINATGGGGGGGAFSMVSAIWTTANANTKNAQTAPGNTNNDGITINLTATSNPGTIANWTVSLNGTALSNTYPTTGTFPNYTVTIPVADITGNAAQTAQTVTVAIVNTQFNLMAGDNLVNVQPVAFTTVLSGSYAVTTVPFYTTTATLNWSYSNSNEITAFGGVFTPGGNATAATGSFPGIATTGSTISGSATGNGLAGAGSATVTLTGSVPALPVYTPAFYAQTANNTPPIFATNSTQTAAGAVGSTITYPVATAATQYNWICTQVPLAQLILVTSFGSSTLVPDVTAPTQTISGQVFNVYGWTSLGVGSASVLRIASA